VEEDWGNCGELGRGGFCVVHKQIEGTEIHYSKELLVMAILAKACILTPEIIHSTSRPVLQ